MRRYLEARDGRSCARCGDEIERAEVASIGHVIARAHGGSDAPGNLRLEHLTCNLRAGADRTSARIVELEDLDAGFSGARISRGRAAAAWNGARNGTVKGTSVRFTPARR
jgi:hypothetical protein